MRRLGSLTVLRRSRVWLAWGKYWAAQAYWYPCVSFGVHVDPRHPLIDLHFLVFTLSLGPAAHITGQADRHRQSCRGFLFPTDPVL
jgi:hypothetical protein